MAQEVADFGVGKTMRTTDQETALDNEIIDIRRDKSLSSTLDLAAASLEGLSQPPGHKSLPSLLLWDLEGQALYNEILRTQHYYPYRVENDLLELRVQEIANHILSSGTQVLVELGAGNMQKTTMLLSALDARGACLDYYALDVDEKELRASLAGLKARTQSSFRNLKLFGLLGTYDDAAFWLQRSEEARSCRKSLAWLGSSVANFLPHDAGALLASFTKDQDPETLCGFLIAVDGCRDAALIECAYDTPGGESRRWIKHILAAARPQLGDQAAELLDDDNWRFEGKWNTETLRHENWLSAAKPLSAVIHGRPISVERGERIQVLGSGKWSKADVAAICTGQGLEIEHWWNSSEVDYGKCFWNKISTDSPNACPRHLLASASSVGKGVIHRKDRQREVGIKIVSHAR